MDEEVFVGSRLKTSLALAGALAFVALGVWLVSQGQASPKAFLAGILSIVFFGACGLAGAVSLARPNRLTLSKTGFELETALRRPRRVDWADLDSVFIWTYRSTRLVAYRYKPGRVPDGVMTQMSQSIASVDGSLGGGWRVGPEVLLARVQARMSAAA
jgi:hypothetical protein